MTTSKVLPVDIFTKLGLHDMSQLAIFGMKIFCNLICRTLRYMFRRTRNFFMQLRAVGCKNFSHKRFSTPALKMDKHKKDSSLEKQ